MLPAHGTGASRAAAMTSLVSWGEIESTRRLTQPRTVLTWWSRPRLRPDPHLRTAPSAVLPGNRGIVQPSPPGSNGRCPTVSLCPMPAQVLICSRCDRGQQYCGARCSGPARRESLRAAGRRYQHSRRGRHCHAERQRRYRRRCREDARVQKVTHHGSACAPCGAELARHQVAMREANPPMSPTPATKRAHVASATSKMHCHFCARPLSEFVRRRGGVHRYDGALASGAERRARWRSTTNSRRRSCATTSSSTGGVGTIASQLGVHHSTVERVLGEAGVERERQRPRRPRSSTPTWRSSPRRWSDSPP